MRVQIEKRVEDFPWWLPAAVSIGAVVLAFILSGIILRFLGGEPLKVLGFFFRATFGSWGVFSDTMVKATPLIIVGVACTVAFKMGLWNIGAEGQLYIGAFAASYVVLTPLVTPETPRFVVILLMMIFGMAGGALYGFIPGFLKAQYKVNEIITTLMLNYIAIQWNNYWIFDRWSEGGFQLTRTFERTAWLPRLADYAREVRAFSGITLHLGRCVWHHYRLCDLVGSSTKPLGV